MRQFCSLGTTRHKARRCRALAASPGAHDQVLVPSPSPLNPQRDHQSLVENRSLVNPTPPIRLWNSYNRCKSVASNRPILGSDGQQFYFSGVRPAGAANPISDTPCRPVQKPGGGGIGIEVPKLALSERSTRLSLKVHPRAPGKA